MDLQSAPEVVGLDRSEVVHERFPAVNIEIIHDQVNDSHKWIGRVLRQRRYSQCLLACIHCRSARCGRVASAAARQAFVQTNNRLGSRVGPFIKDQHIFRLLDIYIFRQDQLGSTLFSRHGSMSWFWRRTRMVARSTRGTNFLLTACSVTKRTVQRACPSGGGWHTMAIMHSFWGSSSNSFAPGRCLLYNARSSPPSRQRCAILRIAYGVSTTSLITCGAD
jgi:hypothetical protein